jgi:hypothetical protein
MASGCRGIPPQVTRTHHARGLGGSPELNPTGLQTTRNSPPPDRPPVAEEAPERGGCEHVLMPGPSGAPASILTFTAALVAEHLVEAGKPLAE